MAKRGFTFIEILVTVTIIAVLIAIAVVSYGSVQRRSRDGRRKSDIEQIRIALQMYQADHGYYPDGPASFTSIKESTDVTTALAEYMETAPSDPKDDTTYPYQIQMNDSRGSPAHYHGYCLAAYMEAEGSAANTCGVSLPDSYTYGVKQP